MASRLCSAARVCVVALLGSITLLASRASAQGDTFQIVSPDWLAQHADDPDVTILDVRTSVAEYQHGHVPGAIFLANDVLRVPAGGVPVQYLDPAAMAAVFQRASVDPGDLVVVYADGEEVLGATMVAYCLQRIGHERVAILDGGIEDYRDAQPLGQSYPTAGEGAISPRLDSSIFATLEDVKAAMQHPQTLLLDTRPATDYLGNTTRWIRNGHIPGAVNLNWHQLMDAGNPHRFKPVEEMRRLIEATGATPERDVIVYCGTSREATLVHQVMHRVLGYPRVRLYEGSWTEYCAHEELPVARAPHDAGAATAHHPPTTDRLEPYECGTVTRLHTFQGIFLASQPSPDDFAMAKQGGVRTVINQRHAEETTFDEQQIVESLGLAYHNPAFNGPAELTDAVLDETLDLLRTSERPVLMHCSSANRAGAVWLAYSVLDRGLSWNEALAEAKTVGLRSPDYERIVKQYVERK